MLIHQMKLPAIIIELDAKALVDALKNPRYGNSVISPLFDDCKVLISQIPQVCINHVFREANKCANRLANFGHSQASKFFIYSIPPVDLVSLVEADIHGESCNRRCPRLVSGCYLNVNSSLPKKKKKLNMGASTSRINNITCL